MSACRALTLSKTGDRLADTKYGYHSFILCIDRTTVNYNKRDADKIEYNRNCRIFSFFKKKYSLVENSQLFGYKSVPPTVLAFPRLLSLAINGGSTVLKLQTW